MRSLLSKPKLAWLFLPLPAIVLVANFTGCGPSANDPEVKKQIEVRQADINKAAEEDTALLRKRGGRKGAILKDIKGGLKGGQLD
jgi:hypothetical protein